MEVLPKNRILEQLPKNISLNFINLYKVEIIDRFCFDGDHWHVFDEILSSSEVDCYLKKKNGNPEVVSAEFYNALFNSKNNQSFYLKLLDYFKEVDNDLYAILSVDEWEKESFHLFGRFLNVMDTLIPHFDLQKVVDYLSKYSFALRREYGRVLERWNSREISEEYAKALIIRTICIMYDSSTYHLMYAILKCSDEARQAIEKLFPEFEMFYIRNIFEDRDGIFHVVDQYDNLKDAINRITNPDIESPYAVNVLFDYIPEYHIAPLFNRVTKDPPLNLRKYQYELAESAIDGKNTVIFAPAGFGKTLIGIYIMRDHIIRMRKNGKNPKIAFIVPTDSLIDQNKKLVDKYLGNMMTLKEFGGTNSEKLTTDTLLLADIFVTTSTMLNSAVTSNRHLSESNDFVPLKNFTLLIFDGDYTDDQHPFDNLMDIFRNEKYGNRMTPIQRMPQIVSITSLESLKWKHIEGIKEELIDICANMDAETISKVTENFDEFKNVVSDSKNDSRNHVGNGKENIKELLNLMEIIQEFWKMTDQEINSTIQRRIQKINYKRIENAKVKK